jgi:hypothetical protein
MAIAAENEEILDAATFLDRLGSDPERQARTSWAVARWSWTL